jgi:hypothetical protein
MMKKRTIQLGDYDTAAHGWTLAACEFPEPEPEENLVQVPGRANGPLDLSAVLTDGEPVYGSRPLSVTLETSEGDRAARVTRISTMVNLLHGRRVNIVLPDHPGHYATGRLKLRQLYNDPAHAAVEVSAACEPWLYKSSETMTTLTASSTSKTATLSNGGALSVVPLVEVTGTSVNLKYGSYSWALSAGSYRLPDLLLVPGSNAITYSGSGTMKITYREAVLR